MSFIVYASVIIIIIIVQGFSFLLLTYVHTYILMIKINIIYLIYHSNKTHKQNIIIYMS